MLEISTVPSVHPLAVGLKLTLRPTLCPAGKASGRLKEDVVNLELFTLTPEMVTLVCPLLVRLTSKVSV